MCNTSVRLVRTALATAMRDLLWTAWMIVKCLPLMLASQRGRWYVFRDAPDDLVVFCACQDYSASDGDYNAFIRQAKDEQTLREARQGDTHGR